MHHFFVAPELLSATARVSPSILPSMPPADSSAELTSIISLPKELAHQVRDVLRLEVGEQLLLLDNSGDEVLTAIKTISRTGVDVQLLERRPGKNESAVRIILCQGLLKSARFEWILEKGTELGVATFAPILCRRSMQGLEEAGPAKIQRWQRIIKEAAEQCGRSRLPELLPIRPLMHVLNDIPADALALMPWEEEQSRTLKEVLTTAQLVRQKEAEQFRQSPLASILEALAHPVNAAPQSGVTQGVFVFIGPEGGFMVEEVALARRCGVEVVTLGSRILRAETAALVTVANVMYQLEQ